MRSTRATGWPPARRSPRGIVAWLLKAPRILYWLDLGWLLDHRAALITHRGRKSGLIYQSMVEVARYDPVTHEVVVASGWGGRTDWYRNIQVEPALEVRIGRLRFVPQQRLLDERQTYREIADFARRNPWEGRMMRRLFGVDLAAGEMAARTQVAGFFKGVSFQPRRLESM